MAVSTPASLESEEFINSEVSHLNNDFFAGQNIYSFEGGECNSGLGTDTQVYEEDQIFVAQQSQLLTSKASWNSQGVSMPIFSIPDSTPYAAGYGTGWGSQKCTIPREQCSHRVVPLAAASGFNLPHINFEVCGQAIDRTATPHQIKGDSGPQKPIAINRKKHAKITGKEINPVAFSPSASGNHRKNRLDWSVTKPKNVRNEDRITQNGVEKKYRSNLRNRIFELQAAIPALNEKQDGPSGGPTRHAPFKMSKVCYHTI